MALPPQVLSIVRAWIAEDELESAVSVLKAGFDTLTEADRETLLATVTGISAETLFRLLFMEEGVEPGPTVEFESVPLLPKQLERMAAWSSDQRETAMALGVSFEVWSSLIEAGTEAYFARERAAAAAGEGNIALPDDGAAQRLMGAVRREFENPPAPGKSEKAGLSGLLGLHRFGNKKDKG